MALVADSMDFVSRINRFEAAESLLDRNGKRSGVARLVDTRKVSEVKVDISL